MLIKMKETRMANDNHNLREAVDNAFKECVRLLKQTKKYTYSAEYCKTIDETVLQLDDCKSDINFVLNAEDEKEHEAYRSNAAEYERLTGHELMVAPGRV